MSDTDNGNTEGEGDDDDDDDDNDIRNFYKWPDQAEYAQHGKHVLDTN